MFTPIIIFFKIMVDARLHLQTLRILLKISKMTIFKPLIYLYRRSISDNPDSLHSQSFGKSEARGAMLCPVSPPATFPAAVGSQAEPSITGGAIGSFGKGLPRSQTCATQENFSIS